MLSRLRRLFGGGGPTPTTATLAEEFAPVAMHWYDGTRLPLPVWEAIAMPPDAGASPADRDAFRTAAAGHWLRAMAARLGRGYRIHASTDFLLLSALDDRPVEVFLQFCQSVRRRIVRNLGGIAVARSDGKHVVMVFSDEDTYYDYISHYYPDDGGEYAMSSGMFVHGGYGHFALYAGAMEEMQPTIAHELTHCLLSHLPIPAWLNEGLAVNTEHALFPRLGDPSYALYRPEEIRAKHAAFWNEDTIQEFWSGKSFLRADDGNLLSYRSGQAHRRHGGACGGCLPRLRRGRGPPRRRPVRRDLAGASAGASGDRDAGPRRLASGSVALARGRRGRPVPGLMPKRTAVGGPPVRTRQRQGEPCRCCLLLVACRGMLSRRGDRGQTTAAVGRLTLSMPWITPLLLPRSLSVTCAPSMLNLPSVSLIGADWPCMVRAESHLPMSAALLRPVSTWYFSTEASSALFSGFISESSLPAGSLAKAASVGANTVNGPGPRSVSASPACSTAFAKVL